MRAIGVGNDAESEIDSRIVGVYANVGVGANVDCDADGSIVRVYVNVGEAIEADGDIDCRKEDYIPYMKHYVAFSYVHFSLIASNLHLSFMLEESCSLQLNCYSAYL
ncbi:hypothetical protein V6N12_045349 [Hibiscus sabdariffa]|uniref:Uncharacterized protein n=1 Tax=Hibiscus sabdariffa TaxID=183260 RepID=A0ABR2G2G7_9ROSI